MIQSIAWRLHLFVIIRGKYRTSHFTPASKTHFLSSLLPNQHLTRVVALSWKSQSAIQRSQHGRHSSLWKQLSVDRMEKLQMLYPQVDTHGNPRHATPISVMATSIPTVVSLDGGTPYSMQFVNLFYVSNFILFYKRMSTDAIQIIILDSLL